MAERRKERNLGTGLGALQGALPGSADPAAAPQHPPADPAQGKKPVKGAPKGSQRPPVDTVSGPKGRGAQHGGAAVRGDRSQSGNQGPRSGGQSRPPAADGGPARPPRQDRREPQDPRLISNVVLRPDMQHPGDYTADRTRGRETLHIRVVGARYIPADQLAQPRNLRLVTELVALQGGSRGEYTARAVIDGDTPDLAAIERLEHVPAEAWIGSKLQTGASAIERIDANYFQATDARNDGRVLRIRSLFGWKPNEISSAGVAMLDLPASETGVECVVVSGGEGSTSYETIPLWESTMLTSYAKLVDILMRYKGVIAAYQDPASFKFANGSEMPWTRDDVAEERKKIAEHLYAAIGGCIEIAGAATTSGGIPDDSTLWSNAQKLHNLEEMLLGLSPSLRIPLPKQYTPTPIAAMRSYPDRTKLITELRPLLEAGLHGVATIASDEDIGKMVSALDKGLMEMSNVQIGQYLRGGEGFAVLQNAVGEIRLRGRAVSISPESHFLIRGKLEGAGSAAHLVDLSSDLIKDARITGVRVVGNSVVFDMPKDLGNIETELQRSAVQARAGIKEELDITLGQHRMEVSAFVDLIRNGQITVEAPREGTKFERLIHQLDAATAQEAVSYFNGVNEGIQFAVGYIEVRNGNRSADGRVAFDQVRGMLNTKFTGWVNAVFAAEGVSVDAVRISDRQADSDPTTVEVDLIVGGQTVGTVALTGDMARDQRALTGSIAGIQEKRRAAEKALKEGRAARLYTFVETDRLDRVVGFVNGDVLTDPAIPVELRSFREALRDVEVGAMLRGKIFDRVRSEAGLPQDVRLDIAARDPFTLTVFFGEGKTERMVVTGTGRDTAEFNRIVAAVSTEIVRMREAARGEPTRALYAFLDTSPLPGVINYVGGEPLTDAAIPAELQLFRAAARHPDYGVTVRDKVIIRIRQYIDLTDDTLMSIVGNDPLTVAVYGSEHAPIARIALTGDRGEDAEAFDELRVALLAEEQRKAREVAPDVLLTQLNERFQITPSLRFGERFVVRSAGALSGAATGSVFELTSITRTEVDFDLENTVQLTRVGAGEPSTQELADYAFAGRLNDVEMLERARLAADRLYIDRSIRLYEQVHDERDVQAAEVFSVAGIPRTHIGGKDIYRFRLGATIDGEDGEVLLRAGTQYRITARSDREQAVTIVPEDADGIITSSPGIMIDYVRLLGDPQMLEVPQPSFYLSLAEALHIPSPELTRELFSSVAGTFEMTVQRTVQERRGKEVVSVQKDVPIVLTGLSLRTVGGVATVTYLEQGSATRTDISAADFLTAVQAARVRIRAVRADSVDTRVRAITPVVDRPLARGDETQYRFQERVRRIVEDNDLDVEHALQREYFVFQPEGEYAQEQRITLVNADWTAGTLTVRYGRDADEHTMTSDAFAAALSAGAFKYSEPLYTRSRFQPATPAVPSFEPRRPTPEPEPISPLSTRPRLPRLPEPDQEEHTPPFLRSVPDVSPDAETVRATPLSARDARVSRFPSLGDERTDPHAFPPFERSRVEPALVSDDITEDVPADLVAQTLRPAARRPNDPRLNDYDIPTFFSSTGSPDLDPEEATPKTGVRPILGEEEDRGVIIGPHEPAPRMPIRPLGAPSEPLAPRAPAGPQPMDPSRSTAFPSPAAVREAVDPMIPTPPGGMPPRAVAEPAPRFAVPRPLVGPVEPTTPTLRPAALSRPDEGTVRLPPLPGSPRLEPFPVSRPVPGPAFALPEARSGQERLYDHATNAINAAVAESKRLLDKVTALKAEAAAITGFARVTNVIRIGRIDAMSDRYSRFGDRDAYTRADLEGYDIQHLRQSWKQIHDDNIRRYEAIRKVDPKFTMSFVTWSEE